MHELKIKDAHFYGSELGGFLLQAFTYYYPKRVLSLALTNSFCDTSVFAKEAELFSWSWAFLPDFLLRKHLLDSLPVDESDEAVVNAIDFQVRFCCIKDAIRCIRSQ